MFKGLGIFDFTITGKAIKVTDISEYVGRCNDKIIILEKAYPDAIFLFNEAKCVICEYGGLTCHLALLAREMSMPCVVGVCGINRIANDSVLYIESKNGVGTIYEIK